MDNNTTVVSFSVATGWLCFLLLLILFLIKRSNERTPIGFMTQTMATWQMRAIVAIMATASGAIGIYFSAEWLEHRGQLGVSIENAYDSFKHLQREQFKNVVLQLDNKKKNENAEKRLENMEKQLELMAKQLENVGKQLELIAKQLDKKKEQEK